MSLPFQRSARQHMLTFYKFKIFALLYIISPRLSIPTPVFSAKRLPMMNAWTNNDNVNIYTKDYTQWAKYMNLTTKELNVGPFPSNIVAIPGSFNDGNYDFPDDTIVVENTSRAKLNTRDIEQVVFGGASGVAILVMFLWVLFRWKQLRLQIKILQGTGIYDAVGNPRPSGHSGSTATAVDDDRLVSDRDFRERLGLYYDMVTTMPELTEKTRGESVEVEDIEAVNSLLRKMFEVDIGIFTARNTTAVGRGEIEALEGRRDDIFAEVRRVVGGWGDKPRGVTRWDADEMELMKSVNACLNNPGAIPERRRHREQQPATVQSGLMV